MIIRFKDGGHLSCEMIELDSVNVYAGNIWQIPLEEIDCIEDGSPENEPVARLIEDADFEKADQNGRIPMWVTHKFDGNWQCLDAECVRYYRTDDYTMVEMWTSKPTTEQIIAVMENREKNGHIWPMWRGYIPKEDERK